MWPFPTLCLCVLVFVNTAINVSVAAVLDTIRQYFDVRNTLVLNLLAFVFPFAVLLLSPFVAECTRRWTVARLLLAATVLQSLATLCGLLSGLHFGWLCAQNIVAALAQPLLVCNYNAVSFLYVPQERRGTYLGAVVMLSSMGGAFGYLIATAIVRNTTDFAYYFPRLQVLFFVCDAMCLVGMAKHLCYMQQWLRNGSAPASNAAHSGGAAITECKDSDAEGAKHANATNETKAPVKYPPQPAQQVSVVAQQSPFDEGQWHFSNMIAQTLANDCDTSQRHLVALYVVAIALLAGVSDAMTLLLAELLNQEGFTGTQVFWSGVVFFVPCVLSPWLAGYAIDRTRSVRVLPVMVTWLVALAQLGVLYTTGNFAAFLVILTLYGMLSNSLPTVFLASANLITHGSAADRINSVYFGLTVAFNLFFGILFSTTSLTVSVVAYVVAAILPVVLTFISVAVPSVAIPE